jgi:SAM-dependent methyltransferase
MHPLSDERSHVFDWDAVFDVDDYLHFYADTLASERTEHQLDFLEQHLSMIPPMRVIDLGCGHGRHSRELARRGYQVVGLDRTEGFLELARRDAEAEGLDIDYRSGDMRALDAEEEFDRAICLFNTFGLHRDEENLDILRRLARALRPGGMACIEVPNRDWMVRAILPFTLLQRGDDLMIDRHVFDGVTGRLVDYRVMVRNGRTRQAPFSMRLYTLSELKHLLGSVGLSVYAAFGTWDGEPVSLSNNRLIVLCQRA